MKVIKEENKKFKNKRSKIKMTTQNAILLIFTRYCEEPYSFVISRLAKLAEAI